MANPSVLHSYLGSSSTQTITATQSGSLLIAIPLDSGAVSAPTNFSTAVASVGDGTEYLGIFWRLPPTNTTSVAFNGNPAAHIVLEVSGPWQASPFDVAAHATGTSNAPSSGATSATQQAIEFVIGICFNDTGHTTISAGTGYTSVVSGNADVGYAIAESLVTSSAGAQTATFSIGSSEKWVCAVAAFLPVASTAYTESASDNISSLRADADKKRAGPHPSLLLSTADSLIKGAGLHAADDLHSLFAETVKGFKVWIRSTTDSVSSLLADSTKKAVGKPVSVALTTGDATKKGIGRFTADTIALVSDTPARVHGLYRAAAERLDYYRAQTIGRIYRPTGVTLIQTIGPSNGSASCTATKAGDLLLVAVTNYSGSGVSAVSAGGNAMTLLDGILIDPNAYLQLWYLANCPAGITGITLTGGATYCEIGGAEFSSIKTTSPAYGANASTSSNGSLSTLLPSSVAHGDLIVGVLGVDQGGTLEYALRSYFGTSLIGSHVSYAGLGACYLVATSALSNPTETMGYNASGMNGAMIVAGFSTTQTTFVNSFYEGIGENLNTRFTLAAGMLHGLVHAVSVADNISGLLAQAIKRGIGRHSSDATATSDGDVRKYGARRTKTETLASLSDSVAKSHGLHAAVTDILAALGESIRRGIGRRSSDSAATTDSDTRHGVFGRSKTDALPTESDSARGILVTLVQVFEPALHVVDSVIRKHGAAARIAESLGSLADTVTRRLHLGRATSDALPTEHDAPSGHRIFIRAVSDAIRLVNDNAGRIHYFVIAVADALHFEDGPEKWAAATADRLPSLADVARATRGVLVRLRIYLPATTDTPSSRRGVKRLIGDEQPDND